MKNRSVILTVGLPGAGKSTCSRRAAETMGCNVIHVEDWLTMHRFEYGDRYGNSWHIEETWPSLWAHVRDVSGAYHGSVVLDMWLSTPKRRMEVIGALRKVGMTDITCWRFNTPPAVCRERYKDREMRNVPADDPRILRKLLSTAHFWDCLSEHFTEITLEELGPEYFDRVIRVDGGYAA